MTRIDDMSFDLLLRDAHTFGAWLDTPVDPALLHQIYDMAKWGPTSMNCCPLRITFITSPKAKAKLKPCLSPGNVDKTMQAPVTALFAYDREFYDHMARLWPHSDAKAMFAGKEVMIEDAAFRNATLQAAYFMLAARGLGLDCGPMSGFDKDSADTAFHSGTKWRSNFLCNLGYGNKAKLHPRLPRLDFDEAARIV